jgi:hypothetical protein
MTPAPEAKADEEMSRPARRKNGRQQGEGDGPHPVDEHPVVQEDPRDDQPGHVGGEDRLAPCRRGQRPQSEQHQEQELDLRLADPVTDPSDQEFCRHR